MNPAADSESFDAYPLCQSLTILSCLKYWTLLKRPRDYPEQLENHVPEKTQILKYSLTSLSNVLGGWIKLIVNTLHGLKTLLTGATDSSFRLAKRAISQPVPGRVSLPLERSTSVGPPISQQSASMRSAAPEKLWRFARCRSFFESRRWVRAITLNHATKSNRSSYAQTDVCSTI